MLKTPSSLDTAPRGPFFGIYLSDLSQKLAFKAAEGTMQPSKGGRQPTILLSYDTYVPHWQLVWPSKPHGSVVAHVIFCSSIVRYRTCSTRWKLYVFSTTVTLLRFECFLSDHWAFPMCVFSISFATKFTFCTLIMF